MPTDPTQYFLPEADIGPPPEPKPVRRVTTKHGDRRQRLIDLSLEEGVDPAVTLGIVEHGENFGKREYATGSSPKGARGTMQIMPGTARRLGKEMGVHEAKVLHDPDTNMRAGVKEIKRLLTSNQKHEDPIAAAAVGYNAGEGRIKNYNSQTGHHPFKETREYVRRVKAGITQLDSEMRPQIERWRASSSSASAGTGEHPKTTLAAASPNTPVRRVQASVPAAKSQQPMMAPDYPVPPPRPGQTPSSNTQKRDMPGVTMSPEFQSQLKGSGQGVVAPADDSRPRRVTAGPLPEPQATRASLFAAAPSAGSPPKPGPATQSRLASIKARIDQLEGAMARLKQTAEQGGEASGIVYQKLLDEHTRLVQGHNAMVPELNAASLMRGKPASAARKQQGSAEAGAVQAHSSSGSIVPKKPADSNQVNIYLGDFLQEGKTPTVADVSARIAEQLDFTPEEAKEYAGELGRNPFYGGAKDESAAMTSIVGRTDKSTGMVSIPAMHPDALASTKRWLKDHRQKREQEALDWWYQQHIEKLAGLGAEEKKKAIEELGSNRDLTAEEREALDIDKPKDLMGEVSRVRSVRTPGEVVGRAAADVASGAARGIGQGMEYAGASAQDLPVAPLRLFEEVFGKKIDPRLMAAVKAGRDKSTGTAVARFLEAQGARLSTAAERVGRIEGLAPGIPKDLFQAGGSSLPFFAMGGLPGTAGKVGIALVGWAMQAGATYDEALKSGLTPEQALIAAHMNGPSGMLEMWGLGGTLGRLARAKLTEGFVKQVLKATGKELTEEALQEMTQQTMGNLVAQGFYDPERGTFQGVGYAGLIAAITGGVMGGGAHAIGLGIQKAGNALEARRADPVRQLADAVTNRPVGGGEPRLVKKPGAVADLADAVTGRPMVAGDLSLTPRLVKKHDVEAADSALAGGAVTTLEGAAPQPLVKKQDTEGAGITPVEDSAIEPEVMGDVPHAISLQVNGEPRRITATTERLEDGYWEVSRIKVHDDATGAYDIIDLPENRFPTSEEARSAAFEEARNYFRPKTSTSAAGATGAASAVEGSGAATQVAAPPTPEPETKREFSSTQVNLSGPIARQVRVLAHKIPDQDLAADGREEEPHITVKFGIHGDDAEAVRKVLEGEPPIKVKLGKTSLFPAKETDTQRGGDQYDVVKIDVDSADLHRLNKKIADALPHTDTHPKYQPHVTLAYLKPGLGKKYEGDASLEGREITLDSIVFSDTQHGLTEIKLKGAPAVAAEAPATAFAAGDTVSHPSFASGAPLTVERVEGNSITVKRADGQGKSKTISADSKVGRELKKVETEKSKKTVKRVTTKPTATPLLTAIRRAGGIDPGESDIATYFSNKEGATTGLIRKGGKSVEAMVDHLREQGFILPGYGPLKSDEGAAYDRGFTNPYDSLLEAMQLEQRGKAVGTYEDVHARIDRKFEEIAQRDDRLEDDYAIMETVASRDPEWVRLAEKVTGTNEPTGQEVADFKRLSDEHGISDDGISDIIATARQKRRETLAQSADATQRGADAEGPSSEDAGVDTSFPFGANVEGLETPQLTTDEADRTVAKLEALKEQATREDRPLKIIVDEYLRQGGLFGAEMNEGQQALLRQLATKAQRKADQSEQGGLFGEGITPTVESRQAAREEPAAQEKSPLEIASEKAPKSDLKAERARLIEEWKRKISEEQSGGENLELRFEQTSKTNGPIATWRSDRQVLVLNQRGGQLMDAIRATVQKKARQTSAGSQFPGESAKDFSRAAVDIAKTMRGGKAKKELLDLAEQLLKAAEETPEIVSVVMRGMGTRGTLRHERVHRSLGLLFREFGRLIPAAKVARLPGFEAIRAGLIAKGYLDNQHTLALEAITHVSAGQRDQLGITLDEAADFAEGYFKLVIGTYGAQALDQFTSLKGRYEAIKRRVQEQAGSGSGVGQSISTGRSPGNEEVYTGRGGTGGQPAPGVARGGRTRTGGLGTRNPRGAYQVAAGVTGGEELAYHGSPYRFDRFTLEHIGTGEGAQTYGWGLYFAGKREVAEFYKERLGPGRGNEARDIAARVLQAIGPHHPNKAELAIKELQSRADGSEDVSFIRIMSDAIAAVRNGSASGALYKVDLKPTESEYLLWDAPLSEQSQKVQKALRDGGVTWDRYGDMPGNTRGAQIYRTLKEEAGEEVDAGFDTTARLPLGPKGASRKLLSLGIKGIKYLDQGSRVTTVLPGPTPNGKWYLQGIPTPFDTKEAAERAVREQASYNYVVFDDADIAIQEFLDLTPDPAQVDLAAKIIQTYLDEGVTDLQTAVERFREDFGEGARDLDRHLEQAWRKLPAGKPTATAAVKTRQSESAEGSAEAAEGAQGFPSSALETHHSALQPRDPEGHFDGAPRRPPPDPLTSDEDLHDFQAMARAAGIRLKTSDDPQPGFEKAKVSTTDIVKAFEAVGEAIGRKIPIRVGRVAERRAAAIFKPHAEVIRTKTANGVMEGAHEIGHAIQKMIYGNSSSSGTSGLPANVKRELVALGRALYGTTKPNGGYRAEGFAEFVRYYLTTEDAATVAPITSRYFDTDVFANNPEIAEAMSKAKDVVKKYREEGAENRGEANLVHPGSLRSLAERAMASIRESPTLWIEEFTPLKHVADYVEELTGQKLPKAQNPYEQASFERGRAGTVVHRMVNDHMVDPYGTIVGPPLKDAIAIATKAKISQLQLTLYLWARHAPERAALGKDPGMTPEDASHLVQKLGSPEMELAASGIYEWKRGVLNYIVALDPELSDSVIKMLDTYIYHVPLMRAFEETGGVKGSKPYGRGGNPLKRATGSGRRVKDIFPQIVAGAEQMILAAQKRKILTTLKDLEKIEGVGAVLERVPIEKVPQTVMIETIAKELEKAGADLSGVDMDALVTYFVPAKHPVGQDPIIMIRENGQMNWYEVPAELYDTLEGIDLVRIENPLLKPFVLATRLKRLGTTGLRASFALYTNLVRDPQNFWMQTQTAKNPFALFAYWLKGMSAAFDPSRLRGVEDPYLTAFLNLAMNISQPLGQDTAQTRKTAKRLFHGKTYTVVTSPINAVRELLGVGEAGPRLAEFMAVADEVGWTPGYPMTEEQALEMGLASRRVSTDFLAGGKWGKVVNQTNVFFNANIQGARTWGRAARAHPGRFLLKGLLAITIPTLLAWWKYKDEEWFEDMPEKERTMYWSVPVPGTDQIIQVPRSHESGGFFGTVPEALLDSWYRQDPKQFTEMMGSFFESLTPPVLPTLADTMWEQAWNHIDYFDRPIVPRGELDGPKGEQRGPYTSALAIALGKELPNTVSPRRLDAAIQSVFGGVGSDIMHGPGDIVKRLQGEGREMEPADFPIIGRAFRRGGETGTGSKAIERFYDAYTKAETRSKSKDRPETATEKAYRLLLEDAAKSLKELREKSIAAPELKARQTYAVMGRTIANDVLQRRPVIPENDPPAPKKAAGSSGVSSTRSNATPPGPQPAVRRITR